MSDDDLHVGEHVFAHAGVAQVSGAALTPDGQEPPEQTPPEQVPPRQVESAFIVYLGQDGHWAADDNLDYNGHWVIDENHPPLQVGRKATFHDMFHAAADITKDINAFETTNRTMMAQQQLAQAMGQKMAQDRAAAEMAAALAGKGGLDLSKIRSPGA